jgi:hypothetical protein
MTFLRASSLQAITLLENIRIGALGFLVHTWEWIPSSQLTYLMYLALALALLSLCFWALCSWNWSLFLGTGAGLADDSSERDFCLVAKFFERGGASNGDLFELVEAKVNDWFDKSPSCAGNLLERPRAWAGNTFEMGGGFLEREEALAGDLVAFGEAFEMGGGFLEREEALAVDSVVFGEALTGD